MQMRDGKLKANYFPTKCVNDSCKLKSSFRKIYNSRLIYVYTKTREERFSVISSNIILNLFHDSEHFLLSNLRNAIEKVTIERSGKHAKELKLFHTI